MNWCNKLIRKLKNIKNTIKNKLSIIPILIKNKIILILLNIRLINSLINKILSPLNKNNKLIMNLLNNLKIFPKIKYY